MSVDNIKAKQHVLASYENGLVFSQSDLAVLSDVNKNVLLTNYLTLKGTAFYNIDRECWKYLVSYNMQFFFNWDMQEVCDIKLSDIKYVNDTLIRCESNYFFAFLPALDKSEISPITMLACFLWDRMNVYEDHNRDLPVVYNTDARSASDLKYRIATKADMVSNVEFVNDVPLFRGKSVLQNISMNTVTKQYSKANQLINKSYKKNEFFTKLDNDLYLKRTLSHREINKTKILEYLNNGKNINKPITSITKSSLIIDPILKDLYDETLEKTIIDLYQEAHQENYDSESLKSAEQDVVKLQIYKFVEENFRLIFPNDDKLVSLLSKHLLIGVPLIYSKLPHGLIRTSFNHLKLLPGFTVYWEKMLSGKNQIIDQNVKTKLNSGEQLNPKNNTQNSFDSVSLDVIKLSIYKEIYENCNDFTDFKEYLLKILLKNGVQTSKSKNILGKKRKSEFNRTNSVEVESDKKTISQNSFQGFEPSTKKVKINTIVKIPSNTKINEKYVDSENIGHNSLLLKEDSHNNVNENSIIDNLPLLKQRTLPVASEIPTLETPQLFTEQFSKDNEAIDPALVAIEGYDIPEALNPLTNVKNLVLDWFSPKSTQISKLDKLYKANWRANEPLKSQYEFQKNFSPTFKKLTKRLIKEGSIEDMNMASATCVERIQEYVDAEFNGNLKDFLQFLNDYKRENGKIWEGE
ncbi:hypothetical protein QEN19_000145 [Hanseniaspora menglaensis]